MSSPPAKRPILGWVLGLALLIGLLAVVHITVGWKPLLVPWQEIHPWFLMVGFGLMVVSYAIRTIRIHEFFSPATAGGSVRTFRIVLIHNLFNTLLPMRSGEASFPVLMGREFHVPASRSIPGLLYLRALDLHLVLFLGSLAFTRLGFSVGWILAGLLALVPYGIYGAQEWLRSRVSGREGRFAKFVQEGLAGLPAEPARFWRTWLWTTLNWTVKLLVLAWILRAFMPMPFFVAILGTATGELSSVLPFHGVAGAGTYEAGVLAGLVPLGVPPVSALKAAVNLHLFVLGASILAGSAAFLVPSGNAKADESSRDS